jgi:hypothetical protein
MIIGMREIDPMTGRRMELVITHLEFGGGSRVALPTSVPVRGVIFFMASYWALVILFGADTMWLAAALVVAWAATYMTRPPVEAPPSTLPDLREARQ